MVGLFKMLTSNSGQDSVYLSHLVMQDCRNCSACRHWRCSFRGITGRWNWICYPPNCQWQHNLFFLFWPRQSRRGMLWIDMTRSPEQITSRFFSRPYAWQKTVWRLLDHWSQWSGRVCLMCRPHCWMSAFSMFVMRMNHWEEQRMICSLPYVHTWIMKPILWSH